MAESNKYDFTKLNTLAVVSLASGLTLLGSVAAVITGHIALAQLKTSKENGRGFAIAGLVLGYAGIAFGVLFTILNVVLDARHGIRFDDGNNFQFNDRNGFDNNGMNNGGFIPPVGTPTATPVPTN